ncbi:MAG: HNH endonuclease [candidate division Zixibacteria bacterium]|nr:HNH endonuclease [candidate division Zixibacteria bacterium]
MIPEKIFEYRRKPVLVYYYILKKLSYREIAKVFNVDRGTILYWLRKNKVKMRTTGETNKGRVPWSKGLSGEKHPLWKGGSKRTYGRIARKAWEEYWMQEVPEGQLIHHFDENRKNNDITNLVNMPFGYHSRYHRNKIKSEPI